MSRSPKRRTTPIAPDQRRRRLLKAAVAAGTMAATGPWPITGFAGKRGSEAPRVLVVGAGVFGGWTALHLQQRGARVTLVDPWGPGNSRASSGGETRVIRGIYGADAIYLDWVVRSFELWERAEREWREPLYTPTGALWMFRGEDGYARSALPLLKDRGLPVADLDTPTATQRFPMIRFDGVRSIFHERKAGFLAARHACRSLLKAFKSSGGEYRQAAAKPGPMGGERLQHLRLSDGGQLTADAYVFACGPWLGSLFPELLGEVLRPTRQEVYYFGAPADDPSYEPGRFPVWVDFGEQVYYGIPGNLGRGFKVADDTRGERIDPTTMQRTPTPAGIARTRRFLAQRIPGLKDAPLVESRVCQYTNTPDGHFVLDRHPDAANLWLAGGGSGHGFKLGPAVGEHVAELVLGETKPMEKFALERLSKSREVKTQLS